MPRASSMRSSSYAYTAGADLTASLHGCEWLPEASHRKGAALLGLDQIRPEHRAAGATGHPHTGTQGGATAILVGLESIYETHVSHPCTASDRTIGPGSLHDPRNGLIEERG